MSFLRLAITVDNYKNDNYSCYMVELIKTDIFDHWLSDLRDRQARVRIDLRVRRLSLGHFGDVKPVGEGISELRIHYGAGYRVYFKKHGDQIILLLCGGDKSTQDKDIKDAKHLAQEWRKSNHD